MPGYLAQINEKLAEVVREQQTISRELRRQGRILMALDQQEQKAVNDLSAAVEEMAGDLSTVLAAATDASAQIAALKTQAGLDQATIAALQAAQDSIDQDVVGALSPITQRITGIDAGLKSPPSPDAPLSAKQ